MVFELNPGVHTSAGGTLIAVPLDGSSPTNLVGLQDTAAAIRPDGGAVAVPSAGGIAIWEPSGVARWLVPPEQTTVTQGAVWAPDGGHLYFGRVKSVVGGSAEDLGIFRVRADGSGLQKIVDGQPPGPTPLSTISSPCLGESRRRTSSSGGVPTRARASRCSI
jgi:hypothetical protein